MATPAASAFHRRRLINNSSPSGLTTVRRSAQSGSQAPVVQSILSTAQAPPVQRTYAQNRPVPTPASLNFASFLYSYVAPLLSFAHTTLPQVATATLVSILLAHVLRSLLISTLGSLFLTCPTTPPPLPLSVMLVNFFLIFPLILFVLITHFFMFRAATSKPSVAIHYATSLCTTPPLTLVFSYLIYGPFLSPHHFFCTIPPSVVPLRQAVNTPVFAAFFAAPALTFLIFRLRPHMPPPYAFPRSSLSRALSALPSALLVASLSTLPALLPTLVSALFSRPQRSFYPSLILTLSRSLSAAFATAAALLPHSLLLAYHPQSETPLSTPPPPEAVQDARSTLANAPNSPPSDVRAALTLLTNHPVNLHPFPPFSDPSARLWRASLDAALAPLVTVAEQLRAPQYASDPPALLQQSVYPGNSDNAHSANSSSQQAAALPYGTPTLPFGDVADSLAALRYLPGLFAASRMHDSFGVAHPTLPPTLALLLSLRERSVAALNAAPQNAHALPWLPRLPAAIRPPPQTASLAAIADAVTVCIYRFTDMFRDQAVRYVEGREVSWDNEASQALSNFLSFTA